MSLPRDVTAVTAMSLAEQDVAVSAMRNDPSAALGALRRVRPGRSVMAVAVEWPFLFAAYCRLLGLGGAHADEVARIFWPTDAADVRDAPAKVEQVFFSVCIANLLAAIRDSDFPAAEEHAVMASLLPPGRERRKLAFWAAVEQLLRALMRHQLLVTDYATGRRRLIEGLVGRLAHRLELHGHHEVAARLFVAVLLEPKEPIWQAMAAYVRLRPQIAEACLRNEAAGRLMLQTGAIALLSGWAEGTGRKD